MKLLATNDELLECRDYVQILCTNRASTSVSAF